MPLLVPWSLLLSLIAALSTVSFFHVSRNLKAEVIQGASKSIYILENGVKRMVPDWNTFVSLGYGASDIKRRPEELVRNYPEGDPVSVIAGAENLAGQSKCPCWTSTTPDLTDAEKFLNETAKVNLACIVDNEASKYFISSAKGARMHLNYKLIPEGSAIIYSDNDTLVGSSNTAGCDVIIKLLNTSEPLLDDRTRCPGVCKDIPVAEVPLAWITPPYNFSKAITCSLTLGAIAASSTGGGGGSSHKHNHLRHHNQTTDAALSAARPDLSVAAQHEAEKHVHFTPGAILRVIAARRLEECREKGRWPRGVWSTEISRKSQHTAERAWTNTSYLWPHKSIYNKRKVYGLILWVGSTMKLGLSKRQMEVLKNQPDDDSRKIIGWVASEHTYNCRVGATLCEEITPSLNYYRDMPTTLLNVASAGYSCAQRRSLRAMSHLLLLFDPDFLLVVDDDSYVNIDLLNHGSKLSTYILETMSKDNVVLGQLTEGKKITVKGFYYGGAGYLMGRAVLERLNGFTLPGPTVAQDTARNGVQMRNLAILDQAVDLGKDTCPWCVKLGPEGLTEFGAKAELPIRLVELCQNMFSEEKTCYHSDHAITRCLVHGAYAYPINVRCWGVQVSRALGLDLGMCMYPDDCPANLVLTCHRKMPNISDAALRPIDAHWKNDSALTRVL